MRHVGFAMVVAVAVATAGVWAGQGTTAKPTGQKPATQKPAAAAAPAAPKPSPGAGPIVVVETAQKGTFQFETYPNEAPKSVEHILGLV